MRSPLFVGKAAALLVLVALAVAVSAVHPSVPGRGCPDFPICYLGALASPEAARDPKGVVVLLVALSKALALGWMLGALVESRTVLAQNRVLRAAGGLPEPLSPRRHLPALLLVLILSLGWVLHAPDARLAPRLQHALSCSLAGGAVWVAWDGFSRRASGVANAIVPLALAMLLTVLAIATSMLQFEAGLFSCGDDGHYCLVEGRHGDVLALLVGMHKILLLATGVASFAWGARSLLKRRSEEALWLPWLSGGWIATLVLHNDTFPTLPLFVVHLASQWLLILGLLRLALRQGREAGNADTDGIGTSGNESRRLASASSEAPLP